MPTCSRLDEERGAGGSIDEMTTVTGYNPDRNTGPFALAASQRRAIWWSAATGRRQHQLTIAPSKFGYADAMTCFARALGAIRSGQPATSTADANRLAELWDTLRAAQQCRYRAGQVDIQWQVVSAWLLYAEGKREAAVNAMRAAADAGAGLKKPR